MSDAIRSYRPSRRGQYDGPSQRGGLIRVALIVVLIIGSVWLIWTTRDSCPVERVIPNSQSYYFQVRDLLSTRQDIAQSAIWDTGIVPENYKEIPTWIGNSFGYPDWVLNNLVADTCYVSGTDLMAFSDLLVVTKMTRIGSLLERYHGYFDEIEDEYAGGLALRKLGDKEIYYAVRGRILVFSPSRKAIIAALTQRESECISTLETAGLDDSGDLLGRMAFSSEEPLGHYFERSDCRLDIQPTAVTFYSRSALKSDWRAPLDALALMSTPQEVSVPSSGGLVLAGSFGAPLHAVWSAINEMSANTLNEHITGLGLMDQLSVADRESLSALLQGLSLELGNEFSLRTAGFDVDGLVPMPVFDLRLQGKAGGLAAMLENAPLQPKDGLPGNGVPYVVEDSDVLRLPLGWGDAIEPSAYRVNDDWHVTMHPAHAAMVRDRDTEMLPSGQKGHLYLRLRLGDLVESSREGARFYAEQGMVSGRSVASLDEFLSEAESIALRVPELSVAASYVDGELFVEMRLELSPPEDTE